MNRVPVRGRAVRRTDSPKGWHTIHAQRAMRGRLLCQLRPKIARVGTKNGVPGISVADWCAKLSEKILRWRSG